MATNFPTSIDALTNPTGASSLTSPDHAGQHTDANDAIEAIETQIGTTASPVLARLASPSFTGNLSVDTDTLFVDGTTNKVGIGTVTPSTALAVIGPLVTVSSQTGVIGTFGSSSSGRLLVGSITGTDAFIGSEGATKLYLNTNASPRLTIESSGDIGIGTISPTTKLDVAGTVTAYSFAGPLASTVTAVTQTAGNSTTAVATTAFVTTADNLKANLASPTFTGTPTLPTGTIATTQTAADSSTKVATTAFVTTAVGTVTSATRALIGSGSVSITPVANTMTSGSISWGTSLSASPNVATSANSSAATVTHTAHTGVGVNGCTVWVLRSNTTATTVDAVAIVP